MTSEMINGLLNESLTNLEPNGKGMVFVHGSLFCGYLGSSNRLSQSRLHLLACQNS
jgi:hypothetical protein